MAATHAKTETQDVTTLGESGGKLVGIFGIVGLIGLGGAAALGAAAGDGFKTFFFSYLTAFLFFLSISLGALFFVAIQHLTRAGWSVSVRRLAELFSANLVLMGLLSLVIVVPVLLGNDSVYIWANAERVHADHALHSKAAYLNTPFFLIRCLIYFGIWALLSRFYLKHSTAQDVSGDPKHTSKMEGLSAPSLILFALTATFAAFDFIMSLDPYWFSTIFGVYFFAGCMVAVFATLSLTGMYLQRSGRLVSSISNEHYHDLGKFLFAFTFFWGYIAFSQFMLIWYANIPEETIFYEHRFHGGWVTMSIILLFGHFVIPFLGLLSRHIKRKKATLAFWAVWMLTMHYVDLHWLVMPNLTTETVTFGLTDILAFVGVGGLFVAGFFFLAKGRSLLPLKDPRLTEALSFENI